jgi:CheY-like chemotaxis protein
MSPALKFEVVPLAEVPREAIDRSAARSERQQPVVMVVDDERVIADTLSVILSRSGFTVITAYDGRSALEMARLVPPELLISDVVMQPDMDGTELAIAMVKSYPDCKILLFSGHAATMDLLAKAREAGRDFTLLTKPVHPTDLLKRISESLALQAA